MAQPIDIGGGVRGEGGALSDAADVAPVDPTLGLQQTDYTIPRPLTSRELGTVIEDPMLQDTDATSAAPMRQYLVISEEQDRLLCRRYQNGATFIGDGDTEDIFIAKPHNARRSVWEDQTINGVLYTYPEADNHSLRIATRPGEDQEKNPPVYQRYVNPYIPNFSIIYAVECEDGTEVGAASRIDQNNDGRQWAVERPLTVEELA